MTLRMMMVLLMGMAIGSAAACGAKYAVTVNDVRLRIAAGDGAALRAELESGAGDDAAGILAQIESGEPDWLDITCQLIEESGTADVTRLRAAITRALPNRPADVLYLVPWCVSVEELCVDAASADADGRARAEAVQLALAMPVGDRVETARVACLARLAGAG